METVKQPLMLMEIERELAGPDRESALAKYDAVLAKLDSRLGEALRDANTLASKILRLTARVGR